MSQKGEQPPSELVISETELDYFMNSSIRIAINLYCISKMEQCVNKILSSHNPSDISYAQGCISVLQEFLFMDFLNAYHKSSDTELVNKCKELLTSYIEFIKNKVKGGK